MASVKDVERAAEVLGIGVSITRPGDGATRYSFYRKVEGNPYVEGRSLGWAKGSKSAMQWLDGFAEGLEAERERTRRVKLAAAACLPDLDRYAGTHGPGPDRRLAELKAALGGE
jgi:hypothetical protein